MSWIGGYKSKSPASPAAKIREAQRKKLEQEREEKRKKLEQERLDRANQRAEHKKQLEAARQAQEETDKEVEDLLAIDPDILELEDEAKELVIESASDILNDTMPDQEEVVIDFEDENGVDDARALQEASRNLERFQWDQDDLSFTFNQLEIKMATNGVKKQYTKFQVLSNIISKKIQDQVKPILRKKETEFQGNAYKLLKTEILRIFGAKPEASIEKALNRVMSDTPSQLARELANDICKHNLECDCCPAVVMALWKRHLPGQVKAGIAGCVLSKETFDSTTQLADDIWSSNRPSASSVAAISSAPLDETLPAIPYATPEINAVSRGRGRGNRGRGRGCGRGGQNGQQPQTSGGPKHKGTKHPDLPAGDWTGCSMHFRWGRGAHFCSEPGSCPWRNVFTPKPAK